MFKLSRPCNWQTSKDFKDLWELLIPYLSLILWGGYAIASYMLLSWWLSPQLQSSSFLTSPPDALRVSLPVTCTPVPHWTTPVLCRLIKPPHTHQALLLSPSSTCLCYHHINVAFSLFLLYDCFICWPAFQLPPCQTLFACSDCLLAKHKPADYFKQRLL